MKKVLLNLINKNILLSLLGILTIIIVINYYKDGGFLLLLGIIIVLILLIILNFKLIKNWFSYNIYLFQLYLLAIILLFFNNDNKNNDDKDSYSNFFFKDLYIPDINNKNDLTEFKNTNSIFYKIFCLLFNIIIYPCIKIIFIIFQVEIIFYFSFINIVGLCI